MTSLVLSGLLSKRAELLRDITISKDRTAMLEADLASIEGAIRVFDPDTALPDKGRRAPAINAAPEGQMGRYVMACLRQNGPQDTKQVTRYVMEQRQLDPSDKRLWRTMCDRTGAALYRLRKSGLVVSRKDGRGGLLVWGLK